LTSLQSVEKQARRIPDSVAKLRYLRKAAQPRKTSRRLPGFLLSLISLGFSLGLLSPPAKPRATPVVFVAPVPAPEPDRVFLVERKVAVDLYSNGLEIRSEFETTGAPRVFRRFERRTLAVQEPLSEPVGIVFHTTESLVAPIVPDQVSALSRNREDVLAHVHRDKLYNFVIDRFGRVFRVVPENQTAFHAGHSVWADADFLYIDLNESFLGVSFETKAGEAATTAQVHAGRLLTELLRSKYRIPDGNCVTHAQVSVNPDNFRIGYHTDWGGGFPFADVGLAVGYRARIAAVEVFGFGYDEHFLEAVGGTPWEGLAAAEQQVLIDAAAHSTLSSRYRNNLQQQYQTLRRHRHEKP
jgi:hypothetical protein